MSREKMLEAICRMPADHWKHGRGSMVRLFVRCGYREAKEVPTAVEFERYLERHPDYVEDWLDNSYDNRGSPAWYFQPHRKKSGIWVVGFYPDGEVRNFTKKNAACAYYITRYLELLSELLKKPEFQALLKLEREEAARTTPGAKEDND